jgi:hypothetical protein
MSFSDLTPENTIQGGTDGTFIGNVGDSLKVTPTKMDSEDLKDFFLEVAKGNIPKYSFIAKFGATPEIDADDFETVWDVPKAAYPWPTSAQTTTVSSNDTSDTSGGTGARTIEVQGLDGNWDFQKETVTMNGTSNVTLSTQFFRVFRIKVLTAGSQGTNDGDIDVKHGSTVIGRITEAVGQSLMAVFTIGRNQKGYLYEWHSEIGPKIGGTADKTGRSYLQARTDGSVFQTKDYRYHQSDGQQIDQKYQCPLVFPEKTDIQINVFCETGNNALTAGFFILLEDTTL